MLIILALELLHGLLLEKRRRIFEQGCSAMSSFPAAARDWFIAGLCMELLFGFVLEGLPAVAFQRFHVIGCPVDAALWSIVLAALLNLLLGVRLEQRCPLRSSDHLTKQVLSLCRQASRPCAAVRDRCIAVEAGELLCGVGPED